MSHAELNGATPANTAVFSPLSENELNSLSTSDAQSHAPTMAGIRTKLDSGPDSSNGGIIAHFQHSEVATAQQTEQVTKERVGNMINGAVILYFLDVDFMHPCLDIETEGNAHLKHTAIATVNSASTPTLEQADAMVDTNISPPPEIKAAQPIIPSPEPTSPPKPKSTISFEDYLAFKTLSFEWAESYDTKDFARLSAILCPVLNIDYSIVNPMLPKEAKMPKSDFLAFVSSPHFLGDHCIRTQHLLGASKFAIIEPPSQANGESLPDYGDGGTSDFNSEEGMLVKAEWQIRAAHQRYEDRKDGGEPGVVARGHGHAMLEHWYRRVHGEWKLAGVRPNVRWNEGDFGGIFRGAPAKM